MVAIAQLKQQLQAIGADFQFLGRAEIKELPKILFDDERVHHVVFGKYEGGFAILCATNQRVLLIDKKPFYLTLEDVRYDMISDMMFNNRLLTSSLMLGTPHKSITFIGYNPHRLREMSTYIQKRVLDFRTQQNAMPTQQPISGLFSTYNPGEASRQPQSPAITSPYRNPVVIRRRVSKFL